MNVFSVNGERLKAGVHRMGVSLGGERWYRGKDTQQQGYKTFLLLNEGE